MLAYTAIAKAASFAMPDEKYGELVAVAIVLKEGQSLNQDELKEFLQDKLSSFKVPVKVFLIPNSQRPRRGKFKDDLWLLIFFNHNYESAWSGFLLFPSSWI